MVGKRPYNDRVGGFAKAGPPTLFCRKAITSIMMVVLGLGSLGAGSALGQSTRFQLSDESRLAIEGTSNVNSFVCEAADMRSEEHPETLIQGDGFVMPGLRLIVPVASLECGKRRMNRDLQDALLSSDHPEIQFTAHSIEMVAPAAASSESQAPPPARVTGELFLAGATKSVSVDVTGWIDAQQRLNGSGSIDLDMSSFGVDPPRALLGLIRTHDRVTIRFHLVAVAMPANSN